MPMGLFDEKTPLNPDADLDGAFPVIVVRSEDPEKFVVVDGCKRVLGFRAIDRRECACGIIQDTQDPKTWGLLRIRCNQKRRLNIRESVCFLTWIEKNYSGDAFEAFAGELGFSPSIRFELKPLQTCAVMVIDAIEQGRLGIRAAADLCLLDNKDQAAFLETFREMLLSQQTQREFLEWLPEIASAQKTTVEEILHSENIQKTIADKTLNGPQKIESIRAVLFSKKFPHYSETLKRWKKLASALTKTVLKNEPSSQVVFIPSPGFEKNNLELRISIAHAKAAGEIFSRLSEIPTDMWGKLIYPIAESHDAI
jgi:hypothetical protein